MPEIIGRSFEFNCSVIYMDITIKCLKDVSTPQELEKIAPLNCFNDFLNIEISPLFVSATTYEELFKIITTLKKHWNTFQKDNYFQSENARYIFALTHMGGTQRNKEIGLSEELYEDEHKAKLWYRSIVKLIHPDVNPDNIEDAKEAMIKLNELYERIVESFREG